MNRSCANESELFNQTVKTINLHKFYFDGVGVSVFGILGLFGITSITTNFDVIIIVAVFTIVTITNTNQNTTQFTILFFTLRKCVFTPRKCVDPGSSLKTWTKRLLPSPPHGSRLLRHSLHLRRWPQLLLQSI